VTIKTAEVAFTAGLHFEADTGSGRHFAYDDDPDGGIGPLESGAVFKHGCIFFSPRVSR